MLVAAGKTYLCDNGAIVVLKEIRKTPFVYRFGASQVTHEHAGTVDAGFSENWSITGDATHYDCGWSITKELETT